jgi:hypothetical protein
MAPQPLPSPSLWSQPVTCPVSRDACPASTLRSVKRRAALLPPRTPPMPTSTPSLRQSAPGIGAPMSPTGWPTPGLSRTGKSVSPPRRASSMESENAAVLILWWRSFFHDRRRPQLENGNRRLCTWEHYHGSRHYCQWQNGCHCVLYPSSKG